MKELKELMIKIGKQIDSLKARKEELLEKYIRPNNIEKNIKDKAIKELKLIKPQLDGTSENNYEGLYKQSAKIEEEGIKINPDAWKKFINTEYQIQMGRKPIEQNTKTSTINEQPGTAEPVTTATEQPINEDMCKSDDKKCLDKYNEEMTAWRNNVSFTKPTPYDVGQGCIQKDKHITDKQVCINLSKDVESWFKKRPKCKFNCPHFRNGEVINNIGEGNKCVTRLKGNPPHDIGIEFSMDGKGYPICYK